MSKAAVDLDAVRRDWEAHKAKFVSMLDIRIESLGPGTSVMRMPFREELTNGVGAVHGGAIASLCDTAFYLAHAAHYGRDEDTVTAEMVCNFLAPARSPHDLIARAKIIKAGKRIVFGEVSVYSGDRLVAHSTMNFFNTAR
ncbi:MAG TPA: PaaI family thioesterase [Candidatus Acidoferrales bacterium]|nr:PaaI family thioesterase [Candidatus Acidoferrales bacterium]